MKTHLNTLYVTTQGSYLSKEGEVVLVRVGREPKLRVPIHNLEGIVCFGNVSCSPFLLGHCGRNGVHVSFLTESGRFLARVHGPTTGNVLLRTEQYRRADDPIRSGDVARSIVLAKVSNCRVVLLRARREHPEAPGAPALRRACSELVRLGDAVRTAANVESLRGIEGAAARVYLQVMHVLLVQQRDEFQFSRRSRRPPLDPFNALLSFLYTLLAHDVASGLEGVGLDPAVGFLHSMRPGRPSLALDLMEELRPVVADRLACSLINLRILRPGDFESQDAGGVFLRDEARKRVLAEYQKKKAESLTHPFLQEATTVGMLPHLQALLLARHIRGDLDGYPPFLAR